MSLPERRHRGRRPLPLAIGKTITFHTANERGVRSKITAEIVDVSRVRNAQGVEHRYVVELLLDWNGVAKGGQVNLRDRSAMSYKLLIGRNWLSNDFVVDVDENEVFQTLLARSRLIIRCLAASGRRGSRRNS